MKYGIILSVYSPQGVLYESTFQLIRELKSLPSYLVVVVNGEMNENDVLSIRKYADYFLMRENLGFDAGAYKHVLGDDHVRTALGLRKKKFIEDEQNKVEMQELLCDELILCNDTFWGPFISFNDLFRKMQSVKCDFWGINKIEKGLYQFIQSYFLVLRKSILMDGVLDSFFDTIDEQTRDFNDVLISFEQGIYNYLTERGYIPDALHNNSLVNLRNVAASLWLEHIPIMKKKAVLRGDSSGLLMALKYILCETKYPLNMILREIKTRYGLNILENKVENVNIEVNFLGNARTSVSCEDVWQFAEKANEVYIYGCGQYGRIISKMLPSDKIVGYVQTEFDKEFYLKKPVYLLKSLIKTKKIYLILALSFDNTKEVLPLLPDGWNVLSLWD